MPKCKLVISVCLFLFLNNPAFSGEPVLKNPDQVVADAERAFAETMANRDFEGFQSFISEEAVFFSGPKALRGRQQVADAWAPYFEAPDAPFSWEPEQVVVLDSGTLALSTGPVRDSKGKLTGTFTSIWQLDKSNQWRIVFDKGNAACDCPKP